MRVALGNGRTDASSVVYVRRTPSELPSARDGQPADRHTYMDLGLAGRKRASERERHTVHMHLRNTSLVPTTHSQPNTSSSSKCRKQQAFFLVSLSSYRILSFVWRWDKSEGRSGKKYIDIVSDRELQTPSQACRKNWEMWEMWKWHGRILQDSYRL